MRTRLLFLLAGFSMTLPLSAQPVVIEFDPRVGAIGARVILKTPLPAGDAASFAMRPMSGTLFLFTLRLPQKKLRLVVPPPVPTPLRKEPD
ncbi:MAG: hypothetical protein ACHQPI_06570 [Thermoanaerobaculia bacterium]